MEYLNNTRRDTACCVLDSNILNRKGKASFAPTLPLRLILNENPRRDAACCVSTKINITHVETGLRPVSTKQTIQKNKKIFAF